MVNDDDDAPDTGPNHRPDARSDEPPAWAPPSSVPPTPPPNRAPAGLAPTAPLAPAPTAVALPTTPVTSPFAPPAPPPTVAMAPSVPLAAPTDRPTAPPSGPPLPSSPPLEAPVIGGFGPGGGLGASGPPLPPSPPGHSLPYGTAAMPLPELPTRPVVERDDSRRNRSIFVAVAVVSAILASVLTAGLVLAFDGGRSSDSATSTTAGNSQLANRAGLDIQALLRKAQPSVVSIQTGQTSSTGVFGAAGSGVIISDDGLVLTNAHVIDAATTMQVTLSDGRSVQADLVGSLPADDIALISLRDPGPVTPAELGTSADVQVGDDVVAIGNALNLGGPPSVTEGIISAKDRTIEAENETLRNLIQTDAAINPGNSGGPLLDAQGQVVGINTAIISDAQNIGFAIAIDSIKPLIQEIKDGNGTVTKDTAYLGVSTQDLSALGPDVLGQYGVQTTDGAFVTDIAPSSAAADGGMQLGDVITAIDAQPVTSSQDVGDIVRSHQPGDQIVITYERGGQTEHLTVVLRNHG